MFLCNLKFLRSCFGLFLFAVLGFSLQATAATPGALEFVKAADFSKVSLSPNGRFLALVKSETKKVCLNSNGQIQNQEKSKCNEKSKKYRSFNTIIVYDTVTAKIISGTPLPENILAGWTSWVSDDRLLISLQRPSSISKSGYSYFEGSSRVLSISIAGGATAMLFADSKGVKRKNRRLSGVTALLKDDPNHIIMPAEKGNSLDLFKVNVETGKAELHEEGTSNTFDWFTDNDGTPLFRFDCNNADCRLINVMARPRGTSEWVKIKTYKTNPEYDADEEYNFAPIAATDSPNQVVVIADEDDDPRTTIKVYDISTNSYVRTLFNHERMDVISASLDTQTGKYQAALFYDGRLRYKFVDPALQKHYDAVDAYFNKEANVRLLGFNTAKDKAVVFVSSPTDPGGYYLYDFRNRKIEKIVASRPEISQSLKTEAKIHRVTVRDGTVIEAFHTMPLGEEANGAPLMIMPHGGPHARDNFDYDPWAMYFNSRGFQVVQINFRGSTGYGREFEEAGYREWGGKMQEDVTDVVTYLHAKNYGTPDSTCIHGYSYGGFAALAGGAFTPELYKCIVSAGGGGGLITKLTNVRKRSYNNSYLFNYLVETIGDPNTQEELLRSRSPIYFADQFKAPVLLLHAKYDSRVEVSEAKNMRDALKSAGKEVTYIELDREGHNQWQPESYIIYMEAVADFLDEHVK